MFCREVGAQGMSELLEVLAASTESRVEGDGTNISVTKDGTTRVYRVREDSRHYTETGREELRAVNGSAILDELRELHREISFLLCDSHFYDMIKARYARDTYVLTLGHLVEEAKERRMDLDLSKPLDKFSPQALWTVTKRYGLSLALCCEEGCRSISFGGGWYGMPRDIEADVFNYLKKNKPTSGVCPSCEYKLVKQLK